MTWAIVRDECSADIRQFAKYVVTKDEHGQDELSVRQFPTPQQKPYVWDLIDTVMNEQLVLVEKSRQLMVTWTMCLVCLWFAKYRKNRLIFVQSKKEDDAANLVFNKEWPVARISFMESNLPEPLQCKPNPSYGKLQFKTGSLIWGIPEGGDQIRSYTASLIFDDEFAFQPEAESAWKAALPSIKGGGKFVAVSSARSGAYMRELIQRF